MIEELISPSPAPLPADTDAERAVLGTIILDAKRWDHVCDVIPSALIAQAVEALNGSAGPKRNSQEPLFFSRQHQITFGALCEMGESNETISLPTLAARLRSLGLLEQVGGETYLAGLEDDIFSLDHLPQLLKGIFDLWRRRVFLREQGKLLTEAADTGQPLEDVIERAESSLFELSRGNGDSKGLRQVRADADQVFDTIQKRSRGELPDRGIDTGLPDLDRLLPGMSPANLIILAARTSMGKTALGLQIACHVALKRGRGVWFFSLEMSVEELLHRLYALESGVSLSRLRGAFGCATVKAMNLKRPVTAWDRPPSTSTTVQTCRSWRFEPKRAGWPASARTWPWSSSITCN